jgi:hypothetical protein
MVTLFLAILASIIFGLFISAAVTNRDIVIYIILGQLFAQIILSGTMFPMGENPIMRATIANWTIDSMGSVADMEGLNNEVVGCGISEQDLGPDLGESLIVGCEPKPPRELDLTYEASEEHVLLTWVGLLAHTVFWGALTFIVLLRRRGR